MSEIVRHTLNAALASGGTITLAYPAGKTASSFSPIGHKLHVRDRMTFYAAPTDFTLTFGVSNITLTWLGPTLARGDKLVIELFDAQDAGDDIKIDLNDGAGAVALDARLRNSRATVNAKNFNSAVAAHAMGRPVDYVADSYSDDVANGYDSLYGATKYKTASVSRTQYGLSAAPVDDARPVIAYTKYSNASRATDPAAWDQGGYFAIIKESGSAFHVGLTAYSNARGGSGDSIAMHARADRRGGTGRSYALWAYFDGRVESTEPAHGAELNARTVYDPGYLSQHQLLRLAMADNDADVNRFGTAISIGRQTTLGDNNGFWTGIRFEASSIVSSIGGGANGEAIRIDAPVRAASIGGLRLDKRDAGDLGNFKYAVRTDAVTFEGNEAVILGTGQRISWFTTGARNISLLGSTDRLRLNGGFFEVADPISDVAVQVSNTKVLGARRTGWAVATGTASRSTFVTSTVTLEQLAQRVKALIDDLHATAGHGLIGT